jgi:hypothetical protein
MTKARSILIVFPFSTEILQIRELNASGKSRLTQNHFFVVTLPGNKRAARGCP